ncbi:MAG: hypothetical protein KA941_08015 [Flavobacteriales bacterium]|nr:hypothetical protein [Flavobacteriales bacterium]
MLAPVLGAFVLGGCTTDIDTDDPPVARAYDQYLRWSDIRQVVPMEAPPEDSAAMAQAFINNWLHQQVELHHAEVNLASSQKEFEAELRDYRNSLLLFAYEEALVRQRLDTLISSSEMESYYQANSSNFDLRDDILRARWFRVQDEDRRVLKRMEERFLSGKPEQMREVEIQLAEKGVAITDRSGSWTTLEELRNEVPLTEVPTVGPEGKRLLVRNETTTWFLDMLELRPRHGPAPIELVRQDIRTTILNQRKLHLIEQMRKDLYREASNTKDVEVL